MKYTKKFKLNIRIGDNNVQYWRREWQPIPVFLPRESHGQRNLVGYSLCGHKVSDKTEATNTHADVLKSTSYLHGSKITLS